MCRATRGESSIRRSVGRRGSVRNVIFHFLPGRGNKMHATQSKLLCVTQRAANADTGASLRPRVFLRPAPTTYGLYRHSLATSPKIYGGITPRGRGRTSARQKRISSVLFGVRACNIHAQLPVIIHARAYINALTRAGGLLAASLLHLTAI